MEKEREYYDPCMFGTEQYWTHPIYKDSMKYTDSVKMFMREHSAYWTLDVMASYYPKLKGEDFVSFIFDVDTANNTCHFYATDGNKKVLIEQDIEYTDLDVSVKFFFTNNVLMFPSDY